MIKQKHKRNKRCLVSTSLEKPPVLQQLESPMSSNFLYGRPALERSHSAMTGVGGGSIRPIGFYYEDDSPYEQHSTRDGQCGQDVKSIFLGPDVTNGASVQAIVDTTANNSTEDTITD